MKGQEIRPAFLSLSICIAAASLADAAATVNYQGRLAGFQPSELVVAGTFAPGFNVSTYFTSAYVDSFGNTLGDFYPRSVADGVFRPIGSEATVDFNGNFNGSGMTSEPAGTPIYVLSFFGIKAVLATSTDPSYLVPAGMGSTNIDFQLANTFVLGGNSPNGLTYGIMPFPEPSSGLLMLLGLPALCRRRRRASSS